MTEWNFVFLKDISEIVNLGYARSMQKLSDLMIATTSHDMRTPLNSIISMLNLIHENIQLDKKITKYINVANASANILLYLVNDNLDYC